MGGQHTFGRAKALFEICNLGERWVLAACAEEVTEGVTGDAPGATLVEELEGFFVVGAGLLLGDGL